MSTANYVNRDHVQHSFPTRRRLASFILPPINIGANGSTAPANNGGASKIPLHHRDHQAYLLISSNSKRLTNTISQQMTPVSRGGGLQGSSTDESTSPLGTDTGNKKKMTKAQVALWSILTTMISTFYYVNRHAISAFDFKAFLSEKLDILSNLGTPGLIIYVFAFMLWEVTMGITTPVETAAGMAFGFQRGIIVNAIGKISGAIIAFLLGRFVLKDYVNSKLEGNEYMELVQHSILQRPYRVALIWRFSFLPEFVKNFGLAVLPVKTWQFICAVLTHGLPFTVLWTWLGNEMGLVVKGVVSEPSRVLKMMITGVYIFGFFVSPSLVGMWIKGLRDEKKKRDASGEGSVAQSSQLS